MISEAQRPADFRTTNGAQAFALALAGFEPVIWNRYTEKQLDALARERGLPQLSAREAWRAGIPGTVEYYFPRTPELDACVTAWDEERAKFSSGGDGSTLEVEATDVVRIACAVLLQRKPFADLWKKCIPKITLQREGEPQRVPDADGVGFRMIFPGFITVSIDDREALERFEQSR